MYYYVVNHIFFFLTDNKAIDQLNGLFIHTTWIQESDILE